MPENTPGRQPPRSNRISRTATRRAEVLLQQLQKLRDAADRLGFDPVPNSIPPIDFGSVPRPLRERIETLLTGKPPYGVVRLNTTSSGEQYTLVKTFQTRAGARAWLAAEASYRERNGYTATISRSRSPAGNRIVVLLCTPPGSIQSPEGTWPSFALVDRSGMAEYEALAAAAKDQPPAA